MSDLISAVIESRAWAMAGLVVVILFALAVCVALRRYWPGGDE